MLELEHVVRQGRITSYNVCYTKLLRLGVTLLTVDEWYDRWFGGMISEEVIAQLGLARRLMQLPVAVVGQAVATAALPTLSRLWVEGRRDELDRVVLATLRAGVAVSLLAGAVV